MPSMTAQLTPERCEAAFRFAAKRGERRSAGGVGSGSGEFNQIVAASAGPSISGFGAGFSFGSSAARTCFHCASAAARLPPDLLLWSRGDEAEAPAVDAASAGVPA